MALLASLKALMFNRYLFCFIILLNRDISSFNDLKKNISEINEIINNNNPNRVQTGNIGSKLSWYPLFIPSQLVSE